MKKIATTCSLIAVTAFLFINCRNPKDSDLGLENTISQKAFDTNPTQEKLKMAEKMNALLANEYVLYTKTWRFHWDVEGKHFGSLHLFFGTQVDQLSKIVDRVAERIRALEVKTAATLTGFLEKTSLTEQSGENFDDLSMIKMLLTDHEQIIKQMHEYVNFSSEITDAGSNNLLSDLIEKHEKMAWMLRSFLA